MSQTTYSGSLKPKKKSELGEIARDLGLSLTADSSTKVELDTAIRNAISSHPRFQKDPRFKELWNAMRGVDGDGRKGRRAAESDDQDEISVETPSLRAVRKVSEASRAVANHVSQEAGDLASKAVELAKDGAQDVVEKLGNAENRQELVLAANANVQQYSNALVKYTAHSLHQVEPTVTKAQFALSSAWTIIIISLVFEWLFILSVTVPITRKLHMEAWKWLFVAWTPDHPWSITLPDIAVLYQISFARVLFSWILTNILAPFLVAAFVVFPRPQSGSLSNPSPLTFSIVRFAIDFYLAKLSPSPVFDWSGSILQRFGDLQLLSAATAAAFALYEVVAGQ